MNFDLAFRLFISHSFKDVAIIAKLQSALKLLKIEIYIAEADPRYGESLPSKIEKAIDSSDAILAVLTRQSEGSASVNQEIGYAKKAGKDIIPLVEDGARVGILLQGLEALRFSMDRLMDSIDRIVDNVESRIKEKNEKDLLGSLMILALILLSWRLLGFLYSPHPGRRGPESTTF